MGKLDGKVAIVTGAGRGIGRAIALALTTATVDQVVKEITGRSGTAIGLTVDVGLEAQVRSMVEQTVQQLGSPDILVNNAQGFGTREAPSDSPGYVKLEEYPGDMWDRIFDTGLKASLWGMQAVFPYMKERGGKIINFGSGNGISAMKGTAAYNCTKEAIRGLTRTAANEWGKYGICVNTIIPTMVTDSARHFLDSRPGIEVKLVAQIPLRRMGDVERDIGPVAVFLASSDSDFMTGQDFHVDGGQILRP
jgi:NAD(P)-dependent dehydrogenase (short-subunit alcohol dehydrogenase family)